jgi:hypothetical protein
MKVRGERLNELRKNKLIDRRTMNEGLNIVSKEMTRGRVFGKKKRNISSKQNV